MSATVSDDAQTGSVVPLGAAARSGLVNLFGAAWGALFKFVLVAVLTAGLGLHGYGPIAAAIAFFTVMMSIGKLGADIGFLREIPALRVRRRHRDLWVILSAGLVPVLAVSLGMALAVWLSAPALAHLLIRGDEGVREAQQALRALAPFLVVAAPAVVILMAARGMGANKFSSGMQNVLIPAMRLPLVLGALAALSGGTVYAAVAVAWGIPLIVGLVAGIVFVAARTRRLEKQDCAKEPVTPRARIIADFWRFTGARSVAGAIEGVLASGGILLVSALNSVVEAGIFSAVTRYVILGTLVLTALRVALGPQMSMLLAQRRRRDTEAIFQGMTVWLILLSWPYCLILAVFAPTVLAIFGDAFRTGALALTVLALCQLANLATGNVNLVLLMSGRSGWSLSSQLIGLGVLVGSSFMLVPTHGAVGAAIASGASIVVQNSLTTIVVGKTLGIHVLSRGFVYAMAASAACFGVVAGMIRLLLGSNVAALATALGLAVPLYLVVLWHGQRLLKLDVLWQSVRHRQVRRIPRHRQVRRIPR